MSVIKDKFCEVCGKPALKELSNEGSYEDLPSYYCSSVCKRKNTWKAKVIVGGVVLLIGLSLLSGAAWPVGLILIGGGGYGIYLGYNDSQLE